MKSETLLNLPVIGGVAETLPATQTQARKMNHAWLLPVMLTVAVLLGVYALATIAQINGNLEALSAHMQMPQF